MARAKRATNILTRNQNCLRRSERIAKQRRRFVQEEARYVSRDGNRRRQRNPSRPKASWVAERTQEVLDRAHIRRFQTAIIVSCELERPRHNRLSYSSSEHAFFKGRCGVARREEADLGGINKSEKRDGIKCVAKKHIMKNKNKNELSLNEFSSFSLNNVKEMLKAGFAEGRRRAEQLVNLALQNGLQSGVVEKVSNDVYRVRTEPEKPEADSTDYDEDDKQ
uniref:Uncharacterized protein n=1 Tax=Timema poppense TaxID=170557 RepID=A0A7R9DJC0_TIMPO|nr:unnamed protein product [Timema poppensis]